MGNKLLVGKNTFKFTATTPKTLIYFHNFKCLYAQSNLKSTLQVCCEKRITHGLNGFLSLNNSLTIFTWVIFFLDVSCFACSQTLSSKRAGIWLLLRVQGTLPVKKLFVSEFT